MIRKRRGKAYDPELTTRQVASQLVISPKTTEQHVEHIYAKIGVSTRGAIEW
jgi:DNA-binding CsgD family transcriptional regulator